MYVSAQSQLIILAMSALCGICTGIFYDLFKMLRRLVKPSVTAANIQDGIFWICAAAGIFVFLIFIDDGRMRFYEIAVIFVMWLIYELTISKYVVSVGVFIIKKIILIVVFPLRLVCRMLGKPFFVAVSISRKSLKKTGRIFKAAGRKSYNHVKNFKKMCKKT